jgi:protease-4
MSDFKIPFSRIFWPSLLAIIIAVFVGLFMFLLVIGGIIGSFSEFGPEPIAVNENSILHMQLNGQIQDKSTATFDAGSFTVENQMGLPDLLYGLEQAEQDDNIKGIFIDIGDVSCGFSTARTLRNAIAEFQKSGKFVVAYYSGEYISQKEYYIGSVAKENYAFPSAPFQFNGLGGDMMFFKNMLDKLEIEVEIIRGKNNDFKSAVEPFFRTNMSDSSRVQSERYIGSIWEDFKLDISKERKLTPTALNKIADEIIIRDTEDALENKLIDGLKYRDEMMSYLMEKVGVESDEDLAFQNFEEYAHRLFVDDQIILSSQNPSIAVVLAEGDVSRDGDGLSSIKLCKILSKLRQDDNIKIIVLRINSPGGSALASEEIWREVSLTNKVKKVIISMGDVAASGGYYIATPSSRIFAESTTITGSIGVFGMIPYTGKMFENKLGITFDKISTNKHSVLSTNQKLSPEELQITQEEVDKIYDQFLTRVADGRNLSKTRVNEIARGRVWTGKDAKRIGLVDELGGLKEAINYAAKQINSNATDVIYYPKQKEDKFATFFKMIEEETEESELKIQSNTIPAEFVSFYKKLKEIENRTGMQMRLPFDIVFN